jgi:hypothetical protein
MSSNLRPQDRGEIEVKNMGVVLGCILSPPDKIC